MPLITPQYVKASRLDVPGATNFHEFHLQREKAGWKLLSVEWAAMITSIGVKSQAQSVAPHLGFASPGLRFARLPFIRG